ncbi:MAG: DUF4139 domain-containing protein [Armatimonadota bacterium]
MKNLLVAACATAISATTMAQIVSTPDQTSGVAMTVYNGGFAVVRENRSLDLKKGMNTLRFEGVAQKIDPTSISIKSLTAPTELAVREQNYQYDLLNPTSILSKSVGQTIRIKQMNPKGSATILEGKLLNPPVTVVANTDAGGGGSTYQGLVLQKSDGTLVLNPAGEVMIDALPAGLVSQPSLLWLLDVGKAGKHNTEVSYMTEGITWKADYVAVVNKDENALDLTGWVTIDNRSGATYKDANLQLMAGDVRRVQEQNAVYAPRSRSAGLAMAAPGGFQEQSFFEYHLYTLDGQTTVAQNETKQMNLLSANNVKTNRRLIFDATKVNRRPGQGGSTGEGKLAIMLEIKNDKASNMGMPLPKGKVRVYKADNNGALQFIGEDMIDHTPKDEMVRCYIGDAFDVVGTRTQTNMKQISDRVQETSYSVNIRNRKDVAVDATIVERFYNDWEIIEKSQDFKKIDSRTAEFPVSIPAGKEVTVTYTVRTNW